MSLPRAPIIAALAVASALAFGCGDDDERAVSTTAPATERAPRTPPALDRDALLAVHDALSDCLREADLGTIVEYRNGKAAVGGSAGRPKVDRALGAPEATAMAIEGGAQFVGLRDDRRVEGRTPDWDVLIFASEQEAAAATVALRQEVGDPAGATPSGRFVTVVLPDADANGDDPEASEAKLADCQERAEPA